MSEMVERLAAAMALANQRDLFPHAIPCSWEDGVHDGAKKLFRMYAEAALRAAREPTEAMVTAADNHDGTHACDRAPPEVHWRAMIDAALE